MRDFGGFEPFNVFDSTAFVAKEMMVWFDMGLEARGVTRKIHLARRTRIDKSVKASLWI